MLAAHRCRRSEPLDSAIFQRKLPQRFFQIVQRRDAMMMLDARADAEKRDARSLGSLAIDRAVADVDGIRGFHTRAFEA